MLKTQNFPNRDPEGLAEKIKLPEFRSEPYDPAVKNLRDALETANAYLHQVEKDTGLVLAHYEIESYGFYHMGDLYDNPIELFPDNQKLFSPPQHHYVAYTEYDSHDTEIRLNQISSATRDLKRLCCARHELLEDFQRAWDQADCLDPAIYIHFGLYGIIVALPLLTLAQYRIFYTSVVFRNLHTDVLDHRDYEGIVFKLGWSEDNVVALDNLAYLLRWKIEDYQKQHKDRFDFTQFRNFRERFYRWEEKYLAT